jgi:type IV pilus assembly protein PilY1
MVGSGDREKPLSTTVAGSDNFFTIYDTLLTRGTPLSTPTVITSASLGQVGTAQDLTLGCYIPMAASEKIVNAPLTVNGITYFGTNTPSAPSANSCTSNLGLAKAYAAPSFCQAATGSALRRGGLPPNPVSGIVHVSYTLPDGSVTTKDVKFIIGAPNVKQSAIEVSVVALPASSRTLRRRLYWYVEGAR